MWQRMTSRARAAAVLAGIAAVLTASVVVMNRPTEEAVPSFLPPANGLALDFSKYPFDAYHRQYVPFIDPVPLGSPVAVNGDPGVGALLRADPGPGPAAYIVQIRNIGAVPVDGSFSTGGAWLETDEGERFYPPKVRLLSSGTVPPAAIASGAEVLLELTFTMPAQARPARLLLSLQLGLYSPYALWDLPPPTGG
jgi:hypothetical protein